MITDKKAWRVFALLLCAALLLSGCAPGTDPAKNESDLDDTNVVVSQAQKPAPSPTPMPGAPVPLEEEVKYNAYNITLDVQPAEKTVTGLEKVTYKNRSGRPFDKIYFNLYLNAFSENENYPPYFSAFEDKIFAGKPKEYGNINIINVSVDNQSAAFNADGTVLSIDLTEPLAPEDSIEIALQFEAKIPAINHRTGANGDALWFGNFLPVLAVYDDTGWHTDPYYAAGHPFYSNIANYTVQITTPKGYRATGTGEESFTEEAGRRQTVITAKMARDFAFVVEPEQRHAPKTVQTDAGIYINLYAALDEKEAETLLNAAVKSLEYYGGLMGTYPYSSLDIVETGLPSSAAMGYAQIIFMDAALLKTARAADALAHQIGRQWLYEVIGSDQVKDAWLSEGAVAYLQDKVLAGADLAEKMRIEYDALQSNLKRIEHKSLLQDLSVYTNWYDYFDIEHTKAKLMLYHLNELMGEQEFDAFIKAYYSKYSFKIATRQDFIAAAEEIHGASLEGFFAGWLADAALPNE